jgi:hypothetical protein
MMESRRHIARLYDLALAPHSNAPETARQLRSFRPKLVVVAGTEGELPPEVAAELQSLQARVLSLRVGRNDDMPVRACNDVLRWMFQEGFGKDEQIVIWPWSDQGQDSSLLSALPFPARHLLKLEGYGLTACGGELLTTVLIGQRSDTDALGYVLRRPQAVVDELRMVTREQGVRHYRLYGAPITADAAWLRSLLVALEQAKLEIEWDGAVQAQVLDAAMIPLLRRAGCESLRFDFDAPQVLESASARLALRQLVAQARQHGIYARAELVLEEAYQSIPQLVDVAATFGLDDVRFLAHRAQEWQVGDGLRVEEMARQRYSVGRSRQNFIEKYGPTLGPFLWPIRQSPLVSRLMNRKGMGERREDAVSPA